MSIAMLIIYQIWRFCSQFTSIVIAAWILAVRSYGQWRILPWSYAPIRNAQNCEEINHTFCNCDNAPAHTLMLVHEFFAKNKIVIISQPPDLALADFFLFPKLKRAMKGKRFATIEEIKNRNRSCCRYQKARFRRIGKTLF